MLNKLNRLAKVRDFNLLLKHGRFINGSFLTLKMLKLAEAVKYFPPKENPDEFKKQLKIAFSVGLKISKSAVKRNRFRRQLRESVRLLVKKSRLQPGWYLLFVAKAGCLEKNYAEISQETELLLRRSGCLN
ncbi:MAG: ribonuclease P protein component [Patescibacteria group bacterium]|nr:ribonuclease P protein component [Patescibacteria group bacterium]